MRTEFPLGETVTEIGRLPDPTLVLPVRTASGYTEFDFLLDTGADMTVVPGFVADVLGISLTDAVEIEIRGIDCEEFSGRVGGITVRIGEGDVPLLCVFSSRNDTPFLLGRMGLFDRFNITFDNRERKIVFESIEPQPRIRPRIT